ncbi:MAG: Maf family protein [Lachnospiraceae bacterium]|nr:Maf family protein [Lachnospiraceae bacterium]
MTRRANGSLSRRCITRDGGNRQMKIYLASASPRRKELLRQVGLSFRVVPSTVEEKITKKEPDGVVEELSYQKAVDVCGRLTAEGKEDFVVIGADTVVSTWGRILGKPADREDAVRMLKDLQGSSHQVYTGVTLAWKYKDMQPMYATFSECTDVTMYFMSDEEIRKYVDSGEPMDKAGAYAIQGLCAAHIQGICGDYNNVVGLPVGRLCQELKRRGLL